MLDCCVAVSRVLVCLDVNGEQFQHPVVGLARSVYIYTVYDYMTVHLVISLTKIYVWFWPNLHETLTCLLFGGAALI